MSQLSDAVARSPEAFAHGFDPATDSVSFVRMTEAAFRSASFLDERIMTPPTERQVVPFSQAQAAVDAADLADNCNFIFHISHVGSTLLARLLGEHANLLSLREPLALRTLATMYAQRPSGWDKQRLDARLSAFLKLWSQSFRPNQRVLIKATSYASELADQILARPFGPKTIFMATSPQTYLATILGAENSPKEAQALAPLRALRLNQKLGSNLRVQDLSIGELVAMNWASEMMSLAQAVPASRDRIYWQDFDGFLGNPSSALSACFKHLNIAVSEDEIQKILSGPIMRRYSKAPEYEYDAQLRSAVLAQAHQNQGSEIGRGLGWLNKMAAQHPQLSSVLTSGPAS